MTAQLSRERLEEIKRASGLESCDWEEVFESITDGEILALVDIALAGMDSEPVAWWTGPEPTPTGEIESIHDHETGSHSIPLFAGYPAPPAPVAVPDKWPEKLTWSHHDDMTQVEVLAWNNAIEACRAAMQAEPVTVAWIAEAKKLAELHGISFVIFRNGEQPVCADPTKFWFGFDPAAPEQEV